MEHANASPAEFLAAKEASGPPPVSLWQLLRGYRADPYERWSRMRREFSPVARYRLGLTDSYFLTTAEGAKRVLQENAGNYTKQLSSYAMLRRVFGNGLLTSEGSFWLRQRRLAQPAFHRQRIAALAEVVTGATEELASRWEACAASGEPVSLLTEMSRLTLKVVGDALFGTGLASTAAPIARAWEVLNEQLTERHRRMRLLPPILPTAYDRAFREARRTLFQVVEEIVREKRARGTETNDLLSMLLHARDADTGEQMDDAQLRDEVVTMLLAGHETTAVSLAWTWALLDRHPQSAERLRNELDSVLGDRLPTAADVPRLTFTRAVIDESMRLHPPAYILSRRIRADDVVCGHRLHAGGAVVISPHVLHRHPDYWERPDEFVPERWLDPEAEAKRPRFAFIPFSAGPRQCIGNGFSVMEATLVLATLARRFAPRLAPGYEPRTEYLILARPVGGVPATIERRPAGERRAAS